MGSWRTAWGMLVALEDDIRLMYQEIVEYGGDFGDPIETGAIDPFTLSGLSGPVLKGASLSRPRQSQQPRQPQ
jgi:hypothetical protein